MTSSSAWPDAWPFLISGGFQVGHGVVMAPTFLIEQGRHRALARAVATPDGRSGDWFRRDFSDPHRTLTLFFRDIPAPPALVGEESEVLRDSFSRPVLLTEGIVVTGAPAHLDSRIADAAHPIVLAAFVRFWLADDRFADTVEAPQVGPDLSPPQFPTPPPGGLRGRRLAPVVSPPPPESESPEPLSRRRHFALWVWLVAGAVVALALGAILIVVLGAGHRT